MFSVSPQALLGEASGLLKLVLLLDGTLSVPCRQWSPCLVFNATASTVRYTLLYHPSVLTSCSKAFNINFKRLAKMYHRPWLRIQGSTYVSPTLILVHRF